MSDINNAKRVDGSQSLCDFIQSSANLMVHSEQVIVIGITLTGDTYDIDSRIFGMDHAMVRAFLIKVIQGIDQAGNSAQN